MLGYVILVYGRVACVIHEISNTIFDLMFACQANFILIEATFTKFSVGRNLFNLAHIEILINMVHFLDSEICILGRVNGSFWFTVVSNRSRVASE